MDNYTNDDEIKNSNKNLKNRKIIILSTAIAIFVLVFIISLFIAIIPYYKRCKAAQETFTTIKTEMDNKNYVQAYNDLVTFKKNYDFGKYQDKSTASFKTLNDIADKAKRDGLKILNSDNSNNFKDTYKYFSNYIVDYSYDKNINDVKKLLKLIDNYKSQNNDLKEAKSGLKWLNSNKDFIDIMEGYIDDVEQIHKLADRSINKKNKNLMVTLYNEWDKNSDYYYGIIDDIKTMEKKDLENTIISSDEYDKFQKLIYTGLLPIETFYNAIDGYTIDDDTAQLTRNSWDKYTELLQEVTDILKDKKSRISSYRDTVSLLNDTVKNLHDKIKSYSFETSI